MCLGSYNKTGEHAKQQGKGAEESSKAGAQGSRQGRGPGSATEHGSRAGPERMQGRKQDRAARQQGRAAIEIQLANGRRGATICQKILQLSQEFVNIGKNPPFANGRRGASICQTNVNFLTSL